MISGAYNYYLSQYGNRVNAKYDTHTKSQLKNSYSKVVKTNSQTPVYKVDISNAAQKYAIDLKEHARALTYVTRDLSDETSGQMAYKKSAQSSNPDAVSAVYTGGNSASDSNQLEIAVKQLASNQVNTGNFLQPNEKSLKKGFYKFDLDINNLTYEFEFGISDKETNVDIQNKIVRLMNRSNIGLNASVITNELGNTALSVKSEATGVTGIIPVIFSIESENDELVETFGLNNVSEYPANAIFSINGNEKYSHSNDLNYNNLYSIKLNNVTGDNPAIISLSTNDESIVDTVDELLSGYNTMISVFSTDNSMKFSGNERLKREFSRITNAYRATLNNNGMHVEQDGSISMNKSEVLNVAHNGLMSNVFSELNEFKKSIQRKADSIAMNPMDYVNNKIVAYKNPHRTMTDPYNLSAYTGMMFNDYA